MGKNFYILFMFFFLLLLQVIVLNKIMLFGYVNPYLYVSFIFLFPFNKNRILFLTSAFLLGLGIDFFTNSGGANAFAMVFIAYIRTYFFKMIFKRTESNDILFNLNEESFGKVFNYVSILTFIHHIILFSLINFSFNNYFNVLVNSLLSGIFTISLYFMGRTIFRSKK